MSQPLEGMITEAELMKILGLNHNALSFLRTERGMPYVKLSKIRRVYLEEDLMAWFRKHRVVAETE